MAQKEFILQGFTTRTHGAVLRELFDVADIEHVLLSVAFVSESGVEQIEAKLKTVAKKVHIFAGVRNEITSYQALARLLKIGGALNVVDTGARGIVFHPKLYLVRGAHQAKLIVGSANLTLGGLNNNVEAGMLLDLDLNNAADKSVVDDVEQRLMGLPADYPANITAITAIAELDDMLARGRLVDELAVPPPRPSTAVGSGGGDAVPRIKLKVIPIRRKLAKAKPPAKKKPSTTIGPIPAVNFEPATGVEYELVWESKALTRRDLTIPKASGTHATGSMNLDKGLLPEAVDHRHYFRDDVFPSLTWSSATKTTEEAFAKFHLVVKGVSFGEFDLRVGHTTDTASTGYKQKNAMSRLSWGPVRSFVARPDLIGRTLSLYRDKANSAFFLLEID